MAQWVDNGWVEAGWVEGAPTGPAPTRWVEPGWVENGWVEPDEAVAGGIPIVLPAPGEARGATNYGDPDALSIIYHRNPGPYSDAAIFALQTWSGMRLFGQKMPPDEVLGQDIGRYSTLISVSPLNINTVPLGNDLIGSIGATESLRVQVVIDNRQKFGSKLVVTEPLIVMPTGVWLHYGGGDAHKTFQGQVDRIVITQQTMTIESGEP